MSHPFKGSALPSKVMSLLTILMLCIGSDAYAATQVPHTFTAGNVAKADEVNENFRVLADAIDAVPVGPRGTSGSQGLPGNQGLAGTDGSPDTPDQVREKFFRGFSCEGTNPADVMVKVGPLCVDKYEASVWNETGTTQYGLDSPPTYPCELNGNDCFDAIYARSVAAVLPSGSITWFQAQQACGMSGKRLLTNAEWQMAAAGTPDGSIDCVVLESDVSQTGSRGNCVSNWGVHDMVGNLNEWVADWVQGNEAIWAPSFPGSVTDGEYGSDHMVGTNGAQFKGSGSRFLAAVYRGGSWGSGVQAGVFAMNVDAGPDMKFSTLGFRCAR